MTRAAGDQDRATTGPATDDDRRRLVDDAMTDVFTHPVRPGPGRGRVVRTLERIPLIRWFKGSLPGRISAVFLLAALVTVAGLLYAGPRLEKTLIQPRQHSVDTTLGTGVAVIKQLQVSSPTGAPLGAAELAPVLRLIFGVGGRSELLSLGLSSGSQRFGLFNVSGVSGSPNAIVIRNESNNETASRLVRALARHTKGMQSGVTSVDGTSRVEAAQVITLAGGERVVFAVWQSISDIERTVHVARQRVIVAGIGGASIALMLGVWVTTRLTRRIRTLEAGARKVARGDFTAKFPGEGSLELSSLARALDEMQRQLAELETARRRFIATASHELRTPLSTLQGFLELLEDDQLDPARRHEFVMHASQQAQRLGKLASDLLDLSRLDVGSVQVRRAPVDVGLLLEGLLTEFRMAAAAHGTAMDRVVDLRAETAVIDGDRVLQLLRALVDNALTHTPEGTAITVGAKRQGARALFTVADTGPGIPIAHQREMFEAFVTSDETRGSGLGLAISRELARRMQGDLTVTSGPGSTVFTLSLPA